MENLAPPRAEADGMLLMRRSYQNNTMFPVGGFDTNKWRQYRWAYFRMIEKVDAHLGTILAALRESGQLDRTLIVFTSDHGDAQGSHGWNQKTIFYDSVARVPLMIVSPGATQTGLSDRLVNTGIDLLPNATRSRGNGQSRGKDGIQAGPGTASTVPCRVVPTDERPVPHARIVPLTSFWRSNPSNCEVRPKRFHRGPLV